MDKSKNACIQLTIVMMWLKKNSHDVINQQQLKHSQAKDYWNKSLRGCEGTVCTLKFNIGVDCHLQSTELNKSGQQCLFLCRLKRTRWLVLNWRWEAVLRI